jgi:hypothetical protein
LSLHACWKLFRLRQILNTLAFLEENNMPGIGKWLRKHKLGVDMGVKAASSFCTYPLYMEIPQ